VRRRRRLLGPAAALLLAAAGGSRAAPAQLADPIPAPIAKGTVTVSLAPLATGLTAPEWGTPAPGGSHQLFVVDQAGVLWEIDLVTGSKRVFLDLSSRLVPLGAFGPGSYDERGFLGVAFHPDYATNGKLYTYTSEPVQGTADFPLPGITPDHQSVLTEWTVPDPADPTAVVDPASARELLRVDEPQFNHNAGALSFGPDGFLYVALGDGGNADDQGPGHSSGGNGQDTGKVLGKILRIDVDGTNAANGQYGIPADNPFVGGGGLAEIWAYGFRNPFRFSFDRGTGQMWIGDVGQNDIEEVDLGTAGADYGWRVKEGTFLFDDNGTGDGFVTADSPGMPAGLTDPIAEYDHDEGTAVIGGFVYRGSAIPALVGHYVFGDFALGAEGRLFYLDDAHAVKELSIAGQPGLGRFLLGFGEDADGELYALTDTTAAPFGTTGEVLRMPEPEAGALGGAVLLALAALAQASERSESQGRAPRARLPLGLTAAVPARPARPGCRRGR
jgi:glucose/arabinose dehydrogenase